MNRISCIILISIIFSYTVQAYFEPDLIEEECHKKCRCKHGYNTSKVQVAHCTVDPEDNFLECNVEWPVLLMTIKKVRFNSLLLASCQRIKRLKISAGSSLIVLAPEMFESNSNLEILVVQAPIRNLENQFLKYLVQLKQLDISETLLEQLTKSMFQDCPVTDRIRLSSNKISSVSDRTFENCDNLIKLDLSNNKLTVINYLTFNKGFNLEVLDLSKNTINNIDDFSFKNLRKLKTLNLNDNSIKTIKKDTFGNLPNLIHLSLESNQIDFIDEEAFSRLVSIKKINLNKNELLRPDIALFLRLDNLRVEFSGVKCVLEKNSDYLHVSVNVRKEFEKYQLCTGNRERNEMHKIGDKQKLIQGNDLPKKPQEVVTSITKKEKSPILIFIESNPYLIPMVFGGLAVLLISIIVIAVVCHVKNKEINELRMQEIQLPMMQSTL